MLNVGYVECQTYSFKLTAIILNVVMLSVTIITVILNADYAECQTYSIVLTVIILNVAYAECHITVMLNVILLNVIYAECHNYYCYADCHSVERHLF